MMPTETRQFASRQAARLLKDLALQMNRTARSCSSGSVHDLRVAIRRFTQVITALKPCFPGEDVRKNRRRLKKIMLAAGDVRDCDVALKFVAKWNLADALQPALESCRSESARTLVRKLRKWTDRQMSLRWRATLEAAHTRNKNSFGEAAIQETAQRILNRMLKDLLKHGRPAASPKTSPKDLHRFRIMAKKLRYTLELFSPLYGSLLSSQIERIRRAHNLLGEINDCVTVAGMLDRCAGQYDEGNWLARRLRKRQRKKTKEFRKYWKKEFDGGAPLLVA